MPVERRGVALDGRLEAFQPQEQGAAGVRRSPVARIASQGGAIVLQRPVVVAGIRQGVAQVVVEIRRLRTGAPPRRSTSSPSSLRPSARNATPRLHQAAHVSGCRFRMAS